MSHTLADVSDRRPWDRQPGEPPVAYAAFFVYYRAGKARSLDYVRVETGRKSHSRIHFWSSTYKWVLRAAAYDEWKAETEAAIFREERVKAIRAQARLGAKLREKAEVAISLLPDALDPNAIARFAVDGTKIERLAYGDSTENSAVNGNITFEIAKLPSWAEPEAQPTPEPKQITASNVLAFPKSNENTPTS